MDYVSRISILLVTIAAVGYLWLPDVSPWVMSVGAAGLAVAHLSERYDGTDIRQRRNNRTRHVVGIAYVVAAYFMFRPGMYWVPVLLVSVVLELYTLWVAGRGDDRR